MNRRSFLRFLGLAPLAAPTALALPAPTKSPGYSFLCNELHEFSVVRVPATRVEYRKRGAG